MEKKKPKTKVNQKNKHKTLVLNQEQARILHLSGQIMERNKQAYLELVNK